MKSLIFEDVQRDIELRLINFNNILTNSQISNSDNFEATINTENYYSDNLPVLDKEILSIVIEKNVEIDNFINQNINMSDNIAPFNEIHIDDFVPIADNDQILSLNENEFETIVNEKVKNDKIKKHITPDDNKFHTELTEEEKLSLIAREKPETQELNNSFTIKNSAELEEKDNAENTFELKKIDDPEYNPESFGIIGTIKSYLNLFGN